MKFYHGTNIEIIILKENSFVTKNFKDACKFGYRKSVLSKSPFVYIYYIEIDDIDEVILKKDQNRDRAYLTLLPIKVEFECKYLTYHTPFKLKKFKSDIIKKEIRESTSFSLNR